MAEGPPAKKAKINAKRCFVPRCLNSSLIAPNKLYLSVPKSMIPRAKWIEAVELGTGVKLLIKSHTTGYYCCEDHFNVSSAIPCSCQKIIHYDHV